MTPTMEEKAREVYRNLYGHMVTPQLEDSDVEKITSFGRSEYLRGLEDGAEIIDDYDRRSKEAWGDMASNLSPLAERIRALANEGKEK